MANSELLAQAGDVEDLTVRLLKSKVLAFQPDEDMDEFFYAIGGTLFRAYQVSLAAYAIATDATTAKQLSKPVKAAIDVNASYLGNLEYSQESAKLMAMLKKHEPSIFSIVRGKRR